jgi:hypothetical protein
MISIDRAQTLLVWFLGAICSYPGRNGLCFASSLVVGSEYAAYTERVSAKREKMVGRPPRT